MFWLAPSFWALVWTMIFHLDSITVPCGISRFVNSEGILTWVNENKVLAHRN